MSAQLYYISNVKGIAESSVGMGPYTQHQVKVICLQLFQKLFGCKTEEILAGCSQNKWPVDPSSVKNIGPNGGQGIQVFRDGTLRDSQQHGNTLTQTDGDGRVVIGRRYVTSNNGYARVEVDELIFFNQALTNEKVGKLYDIYQWTWTNSARLIL